MSTPAFGQPRYELREVLGKGGMGVVYRAYDTLMRRDVALKTVLDTQCRSAIELFYREWELQASITHPNIAEIYDIGEMEVEGGVRPYFVMPLLRGATLADLIRSASARLTVERSVQMLVQACRGMQAAHDRGLLHRDLKPSNIFILDDDSVKIIDFGIAHFEASAQTSVRGTLAYMAPEVLQMQPPAAASDIFALGVVGYETLTMRKPFEGATDAELTRAILYSTPPPVSEVAPAVPLNVARTVHKAMAKQPWSRYANAREFADTLARAMSGEPIEIFDPARMAPRLDRAARSFERGEYQLSAEILEELESEGYVEQEIVDLRRRVEQARTRTVVRQLLDAARRFAEEEEFTLALRKAQEALDLAPGDRDALALKNEIEKNRRARQMVEWASLAEKHLENNAFSNARGAAESLLQLRPDDPRGLALLEEIKRREQEFERYRQEKSRLYAAAQSAWRQGEITAAIAQLDRWMALDKEAPDTDPQRITALQNFYKQVRSEHESINSSLARARQMLSESDFSGAMALCGQFLAKYPGHALFQALKCDVEERQRLNLSAMIAETDHRVEAEPDLDRRVAILTDALKTYPGEPHFERALQLARNKRDLVAGVVRRARLDEDEGRFQEALEQWGLLKTIHNAYPGLDFEMERVRKRRESQALAETRAQWVVRIDGHIERREFDKAAAVAESALAEFPGDAELEELRKLAGVRAERHKEARELLERGRAAMGEGNVSEGVELLRGAFEKAKNDPVVKAALVSALAALAGELAESQPRKADALVEEALALDPNNTPALNLRAMRQDREREASIASVTAQARKLQASGQSAAALDLVQEALGRFPNDVRLNQLLSVLARAPADTPVTPQQPLNETEVLEPEPAAWASTPAPPGPASIAPAPVPAAARKFPWGWTCLAAAVVGLAVAGIAARKLKAPAPVSGFKVAIRTNPPAASLAINGRSAGLSPLDVELAAGAYQVVAALDGHLNAEGPLEVGAGRLNELHLTLQPLKPNLRVFADPSDFKQAYLSGEPLAGPVPGEYGKEGLNDGIYALKISGPKASVMIDMMFEGRGAPLVTGPVRAEAQRAVVICFSGSRAVVYTNIAESKAGVNGQDLRPVPLSGLAMAGVSPGLHQLRVESEASALNAPFETHAGGGVVVFILPPATSSPK